MEHKHEINNQDITNRINRLVGHLQGVGRMINSNRSCSEVIHQLSACEAAMFKLKRAIADDHIKNCLLHDVGDDKDKIIEELMDLLKKY